MSDLISRQAAVEAATYGNPQTAWERIKNLPSAQEWIPVSERLPNENVEVLVTVKAGEKTYIESGMMSSVIHGKWETIYDLYERDVYGRDRNATIIAWMPLPEPYPL